MHVHHVAAAVRHASARRAAAALGRAARAAKRWRSAACASLANGGNADLGDLNWVHYVHAAFDAAGRRLRNRLRVARNHRRYVAEERQALDRARLVICNSNRTADDVVRLAGVAAQIGRGSSTTASMR